MTLGNIVLGWLTLTLVLAVALFRASYANYSFYKDLSTQRDTQITKLITATKNQDCKDAKSISRGIIKHCVNGFLVRELYFQNDRQIGISFFSDGTLVRKDFLDNYSRPRVRYFYYSNGVLKRRVYLDDNGNILNDKPVNLLPVRAIGY